MSEIPTSPSAMLSDPETPSSRGGRNVRHGGDLGSSSPQRDLPDFENEPALMNGEEEEEEDGENLFGGDEMNDYRPMPHLDRFDPDMLDENDDYEALTEGERQAAESFMRQRDRTEAMGQSLVLMILSTGYAVAQDAMAAAEEELHHLKFKDLALDHRSLYCDTCRLTAAALQKHREDALSNSEHPLHSHPHVHNLGLHMQKLFLRVCDSSHFEGTPQADAHGAARMHVVCKHVLDWWDWAGEEADHENERPWHLVQQLLPQARTERHGTLLAEEVSALCEVGHSTPPCSTLKDEL